MNAQRIVNSAFVLGALAIFMLALGPVPALGGQGTFQGSPSQVGPALPQFKPQVQPQVVPRAMPRVPAAVHRVPTMPQQIGPQGGLPGPVPMPYPNPGKLPVSPKMRSVPSRVFKPAEFMPKGAAKMGPTPFMPKGAAPAGLISPETTPTPGAAARGININTYRGLQVIDTKPGQEGGGQGFIMKKAPLTYIPAAPGQEGGSPGGDRLFKISESTMPAPQGKGAAKSTEPFISKTSPQVGVGLKFDATDDEMPSPGQAGQVSGKGAGGEKQGPIVICKEGMKKKTH